MAGSAASCLTAHGFLLSGFHGTDPGWRIRPTFSWERLVRSEFVFCFRFGQANVKVLIICFYEYFGRWILLVLGRGGAGGDAGEGLVV
jgi:hypothetical protein